jgi:phospholipid/cholesterol/gamma-HCH transport system substrate-binding protein
MRANDKSNLVKVGIFVTLLTVVLMIMIVAIGKESSLFDTRVTLRAAVPNAENLRPGAVVELRGLRIGFVEEIVISGQESVEILLLISDKNLPWIRKDSKVEISNAGLVGDKYLQIKGGTQEAGAFDPATDMLQFEASFDLKAIAAKGGNIADKAERIMVKLDVLLDAIDPAKLSTTMDGLARTADNMGRATAPMQATMQKLESMAGRFDSIAERVQKGPGTANSLIYDDGVYEDLRKLLGGAERNTVIKYFIRESIKKAPTKP